MPNKIGKGHFSLIWETREKETRLLKNFDESVLIRQHHEHPEEFKELSNLMLKVMRDQSSKAESNIVIVKYTGDDKEQLRQWKADTRICANCSYPINKHHKPAMFDGRNIEVRCPNTFKGTNEIVPEHLSLMKTARKQIAGGRAAVQKET